MCDWICQNRLQPVLISWSKKHGLVWRRINALFVLLAHHILKFPDTDRLVLPEHKEMVEETTRLQGILFQVHTIEYSSSFCLVLCLSTLTHCHPSALHCRCCVLIGQIFAWSLELMSCQKDSVHGVLWSGRMATVTHMARTRQFGGGGDFNVTN